MASNNLTQNLICFLYQDLLLPWENGLNKMNAPIFDKIKPLIPIGVTIEASKKQDQMKRFQVDWVTRKDQYLVVVQGANKQYNLIRHLRNSFAHGDISYCVKNGTKMVKIDHVCQNELKLFGQISEVNLKTLIKTITSRMK